MFFMENIVSYSRFCLGQLIFLDRIIAIIANMRIFGVQALLVEDMAIPGLHAIFYVK